MLESVHSLEDASQDQRILESTEQSEAGKQEHGEENHYVSARLSNTKDEFAFEILAITFVSDSQNYQVSWFPTFFT